MHILSIGTILGLGLLLVVHVFMHSSHFTFLFEDPFAKECMTVPVDWTGFEFIVGIIFLTGTILSFIWMRKGRIFRMLITMYFGHNFNLVYCSVIGSAKNWKSIPKVPMLEMCESLKNEDCYLETYGFKSYAQYFYGEVKLGHEKSNDLNYLLTGDVDKPVYLIFQKRPILIWTTILTLSCLKEKVVSSYTSA